MGRSASCGGPRQWVGTIGLSARVVTARSRREATDRLLADFNADAEARGLVPFGADEMFVRADEHCEYA